MKPRTPEQEAKRYKSALAALTKDIRTALKALDYVMRERDSPERGKKVAEIANALEMANDKVRFFVLGEDYRKPLGGNR